MILAVDIGNTNISFGFFLDGKLKKTFRMSTKETITTDEFTASYLWLIKNNGMENRFFKKVIVSSVVPFMDRIVIKMIYQLYDIRSQFVDIAMVNDIQWGYSPIDDLGVDRVVNLKSAKDQYGENCIVIDFGTATTIDILKGEDTFLGGLILPGIKITSDVLIERTNKLQEVNLIHPNGIYGNTTQECIQRGVYYLHYMGIVGILENIYKSTFKEGEEVNIIFTGGFANFIASKIHFDFPSKIYIDHHLLLKGLYSFSL